MRLKYISIKLFIVVLIATKAYSAEKPVGQELWLGAGIKYEFLKDWEVFGEFESRKETTGKEETTNLFDIGVAYDFNKYVSANIATRIRDKQDRTDLEYLMAIIGNYKFKPFELSGRLRYHRKYEKDDTPNNYFRLKLALEYNITKDLSVQVQSEAFYLFLFDNGDRFDKLRSGVELDYEIIKSLKISAYWLYEDEFNVNKPQDTRIFGTGLKYAL